MAHHKSRKRQRPWVATIFLLTSTLFGDGDAIFGVHAEEVPVETNVTSTPAPSTSDSSGSSSQLWDVPTSAPAPRTTTTTLSPTLRATLPQTAAPVGLRKEAIPILLDLSLESSDTASLNQLSQDVDGLLEDYLYSELQSLKVDSLHVRDVLLAVTLRNRRRLQGSREVVLRVVGNVLVDMDAEGCVECADGTVQAELDQLLTMEALEPVLQSLDEVRGVKQVREVQAVERDSKRGTTSALEENNTPAEQQLQRPSTLSIVFGFALTAIAFMGLIFYAYIFYRKRQKRLRKERQRRETIEYRIPPPRIASPVQVPVKIRVSPSIPTSASTPAQDDQSDPSFLKGIDTDTVSSEGPADSFARELQMAASLDEQAWEDFQRKKDVLDRDKDFPPPSFSTVGTTSPIPSPVAATPPRAWTKSFPYGDELPDEQGVEWTPEDAGLYSREKSIAQFNDMDLSQSVEIKEYQRLELSRGRRDPEPTVLGPSSKVLQSSEQTLMQYQKAEDEAFHDDSFLTEDEIENVDEVARLTRYLQRLEKRKERRMQLESVRQSHAPFREDRSPPSQNENIGYLNNMRAPPPRAQDQRPAFDFSQKPGTPRYTGITMAGVLYQDPSLNTITGRENSTSDDSDDNSYREDGEGLTSHERLGITPFSVQNNGGLSGYGDAYMAPTMDISQKKIDEPAHGSGRVRHIFPVENQRPASVKNQGHPARLADLRTSQAIIDDTQSDANFATNSDSGAIPVATSTPSEAPRRVPFFGTPAKPSSQKNTNQKFSKLRSLFEERPKNAVFPPDENWQSSGMLKT